MSIHHRDPLAPYAPREVSALGLLEHRGWRIKVYGIAWEGLRPSDELVARGREVAIQHLPLPAVTPSRPGVGFMGIHEGRDANLVFVDWWADVNELHHRVFTSTLDSPLDLRPASPATLAGCVWDLAIQGFERQAWVATALLDPSSPRLGRYLGTWITGAL